ncbi:MAG: hypothetical protein H0Z34_14905 [Brevibacillus sp.]|nr:hypothetical protein [Brevibacillus sp.]
MVEALTKQLEAHLSHAGIVTNLLVRTEQSLYSGEVNREIELYVAETEAAWDMPLATVFLYPFEDQAAVEIAAEIQYPQAGDDDGKELLAALFERAQLLGVEAAVTEKRRFLAAEHLVDAHLLLDFHFVVEAPRTASEQAELDERLSLFALQLGTLLRFSLKNTSSTREQRKGM